MDHTENKGKVEKVLTIGTPVGEVDVAGVATEGAGIEVQIGVVGEEVGVEKGRSVEGAEVEKGRSAGEMNVIFL